MKDEGRGSNFQEGVSHTHTHIYIYLDYVKIEILFCIRKQNYHPTLY